MSKRCRTVVGTGTFLYRPLTGLAAAIAAGEFLATWRSGYAAVCKTVYPGSIPGVASNTINDLRPPLPARFLSSVIRRQGSPLFAQQTLVVAAGCARDAETAQRDGLADGAKWQSSYGAKPSAPESVKCRHSSILRAPAHCRRGEWRCSHPGGADPASADRLSRRAASGAVLITATARRAGPGTPAAMREANDRRDGTP
jgi:hypothetical protein